MAAFAAQDCLSCAIFATCEHAERIFEVAGAVPNLPLAFSSVFYLLCFSNCVANANEPRLVHFAGFAFAENAADIAGTFPYTEKILGEGGKSLPSNLDQQLRSKITARSYPSLLITTDLGDYKKGDALALAFVLTWENFGTEQFSDFTKVTVDLQAEALLFDFNSKEIVASYPFGAQYIDSTPGAASPERILEDFKKLYFSSTGGIFDEFADTLSRIIPKDAYGARIQIVDAKLEQPAIDGASSSGLAQGTMLRILENGFEQYLSKNVAIPVLPHSNNQAIGGRMAARFINGDTYDLKIPTADYAIHLDLTDLRKIQIDQNAAKSAWAYASYLNVVIDQPLSGKQFINASFKFPIVKIMANGSVPDDRSAFQESIFSISDQITKAFASPSRDWESKWVVKESEAGQFRDISEVLSRCR